MSQVANAQTIISVGRRMGAGPKTLLAALEAGLTESNLRNLPGGDRDSVGIFQQRPSQGWTGLGNVTRAAQEFFQHAIPIAHQYGSAGELAQAVQRSAFPDRYQARRGEAVGLLNGLGVPGGQGGTMTQTTLSGTVTPGAVAGGSFNPGAAPDASLLAGLQQQPQQAYQTPMPVTQGLKNLRLAVQSPQVPQMAPAAQASDGGLSSLLASASQELPGASVGAPKVQITRTQQQTAAAGGAGAPAKGGLVHFDGKPVASWIAPILQYARQHGWNGQISSGYRSVAEQRRIYDSGVRPAAKPGQSNHNFTAYPGGAVDVTNPQQLADIIQRSPYAGKLVWAGAKDPVHFSHPRNGHY